VFKDTRLAANSAGAASTSIAEWLRLMACSIVSPQNSEVNVCNEWITVSRQCKLFREFKIGVWEKLFHTATRM
jgi:hypothetical protein